MKKSRSLTGGSRIKANPLIVRKYRSCIIIPMRQKTYQYNTYELKRNSSDSQLIKICNITQLFPSLSLWPLIQHLKEMVIFESLSLALNVNSCKVKLINYSQNAITYQYI